MERPDLDGIDRDLEIMKAPQWFLAWPHERIYKCGGAHLRDLLAYARHLEEENKRLRETCGEDLQSRQQMLEATS